MTSTIESIREGRGMLPKNLHWIVAVFLVVAGIAVMYLHGRKEDSKVAEQQANTKQEKEQAIRKEKPNVERMITEASSQASPPAPTTERINAEKLTVPGVETHSAKTVSGPAAIAGEAQRASGEDTQYTKGTATTNPILVLTGDSLPPTQKPDSTGTLLRNLEQNRPAAQPTLSAEDKKILDSASRGAGGQAAGIGGEEYLQQAKRNEAWYQQVAASGSPRKTIGLDPPVTSYTIIQGTPIPAVTVTPVNSDLPGQIVARTTQDIYDSIRGQYLLIPSGSVLYGVYNNAVIVNQDRLAVVFNRIVFPNGAGVTLGAMNGIDAAGQAGVPGDVDNHFWKMFGSSLLIGGIAALVEPRNNVTNNIFVSGGSQGIGAAGQVFVDVTRQIMSRNTHIPPTVKVKAGERFNIMVQQDLALAPYVEVR